MTGTIFPVTINLQVNINALYDTGAARSCMNYDTFFNLGLDLDDKLAPHVRTTSCSFSQHFNDICAITLGQMTGTTFPVAINLQVNINALYDTGAAKSCMNYDTFFNLGLDLDDKLAPHVRTASGTDMGAIGFATLTFAINNHFFLTNSS